MSRIDQLISQYCPAGVPMVRLGEVFTLRGGYTPSTKEPSFWTDEGGFPWFKMEDIRDKGRLLEDSYSHITAAAIKSNGLFPAGTIVFATSATIGEHAMLMTPALTNQRFTALIPKDDSVIMKYMFHYGFIIDKWCKENIIQGSFASVDMAGFKNLSIPLPPLPVQEEIVRILDAMSDLVTNLDAEISARQKQYEHAREKLICQQNYEQVTFESLGEIVRGKRFVRNDITESGTPCIHYGDMYTYYGVSASEARTHLQGEIVSKMRYAKKYDVIIVGAGENNEDIGVALAWLGDQPAAVHDACYIISHEQNPVYISQYTRTGIYHEQLKKIVVDGKICSFPLKGLAQLTIPLPPLSVQQSIVERLDKMESLIQNLQAERDLRQKQYEYYREKLLTF